MNATQIQKVDQLCERVGKVEFQLDEFRLKLDDNEATEIIDTLHQAQRMLRNAIDLLGIAAETAERKNAKA